MRCCRVVCVVCAFVVGMKWRQDHLEMLLNAYMAGSGGKGNGRGKAKGGEARGAGKVRAGPAARGSSEQDSCGCCGQVGHYRVWCPHKANECRRCGKTGHLEATCRSPPNPSSNATTGATELRAVPAPVVALFGVKDAWRCVDAECATSNFGWFSSQLKRLPALQPTQT